MLTYKSGAYVTDSVDTLRTGTQRKGWPRTGSQRGSAVTGRRIGDTKPRYPSPGSSSEALCQVNRYTNANNRWILVSKQSKQA